MRCLADVSKEQVGSTHFVAWYAESLSNRFFDQAFLEADAEIAGENLDQEFCFQSRALLEDLLEKRELGGSAASCVQFSECG